MFPETGNALPDVHVLGRKCGESVAACERVSETGRSAPMPRECPRESPRVSPANVVDNSRAAATIGLVSERGSVRRVALLV